MTSFLIFIWGVFSFLILWLAVHSIQKQEWRATFISSSLYYGTFIWFLSETLSLCQSLNSTSIFIGCLLYTILILLFISYLAKRKKLHKPHINPQILKSPYVLALILILGVTFFLAVVYPPNTWDSMTYHLPRIEHWLQNQSLSHYYTSIDRQLFSAPFAELSIMFGRALSGDDWLMNLVQWFSFLGTLIVISKVAEHLGLNKKNQLVASLFFATVPMAILQASSTQNDLVVTFWLVCLIERFLHWKNNPKMQSALEFGLALGLATFTKGTAYVIALPIVIAFAFISLKSYRHLLKQAIFASLIFFALNAPHYTRNYISLNNPLGAHHGTISSFSAKSFFITSAANIYINIPSPIPYSNQVNSSLENLDKNIFPYGPLRTYSFSSWRSALKEVFLFHEDLARNPFHLSLIIFAICYLIWIRDKKYTYAIICLACWGVFFFCIPWQPWTTRIQTPLFAISAPLIALAFQNIKYTRLKKLTGCFIFVLALFPLFMNYSRPTFPIAKATPVIGGRVSEYSFWTAERDSLIFTNNKGLSSSYTEACNDIINRNDTNIGLIMSYDSWEYPIWRFFRKNSKTPFYIKHQKADAINKEIESIFSIDKQNINALYSGSNFSEEDIKQPHVFTRNINDNQWELTYPPSNNISICN